jgi:hypothetical protein
MLAALDSSTISRLHQTWLVSHVYIKSNRALMQTMILGSSTKVQITNGVFEKAS